MGIILLTLNASTVVIATSGDFTIQVSPYCSDKTVIGAGAGTPLSGSDLVNILDEEFSGSTLNPRIWRVAEDSSGDLNNTLAAHTPNNFKIENGVLKLIGKREYYIQPQGYKGAGASKEIATDANGNPEDPTLLTLRPYTSGRIDTATKFNIDLCKPGRIDIKYARQPYIPGLWASSWIFTTDNAFHGSWSSGGEIDIGEVIGRDFPGIPDFIGIYNSAIWFGGSWPYSAAYFSNVVLNPLEPHTFSLAWDSEGMSMLDDNVVISVINKTELLTRGFESIAGTGGYLESPLVDGLREDQTYDMTFNNPPADWFQAVPGLIDELAALDAVPYAGTYSEANRYFQHPDVEIIRNPHPAPYDHNGFYLILQMNIAGNPYGGDAGNMYFAYQNLIPLINAYFPPGFKGVVSESELVKAIGQTNLDALNAMPGYFLPPESANLTSEIDSVKYYIAPGLTNVCHKPTGKKPKSLKLDAHDVKAHLLHGDYLGECRTEYVVGPEDGRELTQ